VISQPRWLAVARETLRVVVGEEGSMEGEEAGEAEEMEAVVSLAWLGIRVLSQPEARILWSIVSWSQLLIRYIRHQG
jgi:hypothetical protein